MTTVMRLLSGLVLIFVALAAAASAGAQPARDLAAGSGVMELRNGSGTVLVSFSQGAVLGKLANGSLRVKSKSAVEPNIVVWGAKKTVHINKKTTLYFGNLRFRVDGHGLRIRLKGTRIASSIVGLGYLLLQGSHGRYSHNWQPFRRWPARFRTFRMGELEPAPVAQRPDRSAP